MAKATERQKQKKREKQQRKREQAKQQARAKAQEQALPTSERALIKLASAAELGPAWIQEGWDTPAGADQPVLVMVTRRLRGRLYLAHCVVVDRSCLGIADAFTLPPASEHELRAKLLESTRDGDATVPCEFLVAQSVVFHAVDFARRLGFEPHRDFHRSMFEPRPAELLDTAGARPERPNYDPRVGGNVDAILRQLDEVVGRGNYDYMGKPRRARLLEPETYEAPDLPLDPADAGGDPSRINWRAACTGVVWEPALLPGSEPVDDLRPGEDFEDFDEPIEEDDDWELIDAIGAFIWELEEGQQLAWEAVIREEQSLPLSAEQSQALDRVKGHGQARIRFINDSARPCEPWYRTFDRILNRLLVRIEMDHVETPTRFTIGSRMLDVVEAHASPLSLPPGVAGLAELLADERVSRVRVQAVFVPLFELGQQTELGRITLADPDESDRIDQFIELYRDAAPHRTRLGWGLAELLAVVVLPAEELRLLLAGIAARQPELATGY